MKTLIVKPSYRKLFNGEKSVDFTPTEWKLLTILMSETGFISMEMLFKFMNGYEPAYQESYRYINPPMCRVRKKLRSIDAGEILVRKVGLGFKLDATLIELL